MNAVRDLLATATVLLIALVLAAAVKRSIWPEPPPLLIQAALPAECADPTPKGSIPRQFPQRPDPLKWEIRT